MPRKSVYFTPDDLPDRIAAVAGDDARSFSKWVSLACEFMLSHPELHGQRGVIAEVQELEAALGATGIASESRSGESRANDSNPYADAPSVPASPRAPAPKPPGGTKADWDHARQVKLNEMKERHR